MTDPQTAPSIDSAIDSAIEGSNPPDTATDAASEAPAASRPRWPLVVLTVLVVAGLGYWGWEEIKHDYFVVKRFGVVEDGSLYRAGLISANLQRPTLEKYGIDRVITMLTEEPRNAAQAAEAEAAEAMGIAVYRYPMGGDGVGEPIMYVNAVEQMVLAQRAGEQAIVHCSAGTQRTGAVVALYRMLVEGADPQAAYEEAQRYDWNPRDDAAWAIHINKHMRFIAEELAKRGVIDAVPDPLPRMPHDGPVAVGG